MKKMNIIYVLLLSVATTMSCTKDDYVEPDFKTESFGIYSSFFSPVSGTANINPTYLTPNSMSGVMDLSQGELSHEWSFWSGSEFVDDATDERTWTKLDGGVNFIKDNANMGYGDITDYTPFLDPSIKTTTNREALTFMIPKGGAYKLRITNTYASELTYMYNTFDAIDPTKRINEYVTAVKLPNGRYQVTREYEMFVYEPLVPAAKIFTDAAHTQPVNLSNKVMMDGVETAEITINAGETLYFRDATGENAEGVSTIFTAPTNRKWAWTCIQTDTDPNTPNPEVSPASSVEQSEAFHFAQAGIFRVNLTVERPAPEFASTHYPASSNAQMVPVIIYVL